MPDHAIHEVYGDAIDRVTLRVLYQLEEAFQRASFEKGRSEYGFKISRQAARVRSLGWHFTSLLPRSHSTQGEASFSLLTACLCRGQPIQGAKLFHTVSQTSYLISERSSHQCETQSIENKSFKVG
jgi:hypothetical protein